MENQKLIATLSEAIELLYRANASNCCAWAESKVQRAAQHLIKQQSEICSIEFSE